MANDPGQTSTVAAIIAAAGTAISLIVVALRARRRNGNGNGEDPENRPGRIREHLAVVKEDLADVKEELAEHEGEPHPPPRKENPR